MSLWPSKRSTTALICSLVLIAASVRSEETVAKPPLAGLPSTAGSQIEKIKALGDNEWLELGSPAPDPKWGRARGRSWGGKAFAFAPDLRGAFYTGEGEHAGVKPDGFGMDDYWFYDINANSWICVFPGTDTKNFSQQVKDHTLSVSNSGLVVGKDGHPVPGHLLIHAWGLVAYDSDRKQLDFIAQDNFGRYFMPGTGGSNPVDEGLKIIEEQRKGLKKKPLNSPWIYDVATGTFNKYETNAKPFPGGWPLFLYIPNKKQFFLAAADNTVFYDPDKKLWTGMKPQGPKLGSYDFGGCYDSKRDRVYMGGTGGLSKKPEDNFFIYDFKANTWTKPDPKGTYPAQFSTNFASVHYDSANDAVLIFHYNDKKIYVYNPETNTFTEPIPMKSLSPSCFNAFYDPELNAHFIYQAGDSQDNGKMYVYRYKKSAERKTK